MNSWRIHFGWAIVTALAIAVTARVGARNDASPIREPAPARSAPAPEAEKPVSAPVSVGVPEAPAFTPGAPVTDEEQLRALLQTTQDSVKLAKIFAGIPDRALKLKLLREAACGKDVRYIYSALELLRQMRGRDAAEVLEACLAVHLERGHGGYAAYILGEVGDSLSYTPLTEAFRSKNEEVRVNCAESLKKLGYPAAAQELVVGYTRQFESPDGSLRKKAVEILANLNPEGSIAVFVRALRDSNGDVRLEALNAFSQLDKKEYLPLLEPLVNDPNPAVAEEAKDLVEGLKSQDP